MIRLAFCSIQIKDWQNLFIMPFMSGMAIGKYHPRRRFFIQGAHLYRELRKYFKHLTSILSDPQVILGIGAVAFR